MDEIGSAKEVAAMRDIAHRGVSMVASAHGTSLQHLLENPVLNSLVGSRHRMLIGDMAARYVPRGCCCCNDWEMCMGYAVTVKAIIIPIYAAFCKMTLPFVMCWMDLVRSMCR